MPNLLSRLGKSAFMVLVAFACTYLLWPHIRPVSLGTFYLAVAIAGWRYGYLEGLFATALSSIFISYNFVPPYHSVKLDKAGWIFLGEFAAIAIAFSFLGSSRRRALYAAQTEAAHLRSIQQELASSEAHWRSLAESVPSLIWTCTDDGAVDYVSPQWRAYTGQSPANQFGYRWLLSIHPEDRDTVCTAWERAVEAKRPFQVTCRLRSAQGGYHWFKMRATPVAGSTPVKWIGACTEVDDIGNSPSVAPIPRQAST